MISYRFQHLFFQSKNVTNFNQKACYFMEKKNNLHLELNIKPIAI